MKASSSTPPAKRSPKRHLSHINKDVALFFWGFFSLSSPPFLVSILVIVQGPPGFVSYHSYPAISYTPGVLTRGRSSSAFTYCGSIVPICKPFSIFHFPFKMTSNILLYSPRRSNACSFMSATGPWITQLYHCWKVRLRIATPSPIIVVANPVKDFLWNFRTRCLLRQGNLTLPHQGLLILSWPRYIVSSTTLLRGP